jgi:hypothetical protein
MSRAFGSTRFSRFAGAVVVWAATLGTACATSGCRVNEDDVHRWESTAHGPDKLRAVLQHDKYDNALRVEAALSLIRMKPRAGRRIGIQIMVDTLASVPPETRQAIVQALIPQIVAELKKPPPAAQAGQGPPPDGSFPYKDAAYAMLTQDRTIIADEALKQTLKQALTDWAMADFEHRLDNRSQTFGMEQLLRYLGAPGVAGLPKLMTRDAKRLDQIASLIAELADPKTREAASQALVKIAQYVLSDEWKKVSTPDLEARNKASKLEPNAQQFQLQLAAWQDEELFRVFGAMKKVGGRPVVDFALEFGGKKDQSEKRRQAALAALEGRLDRNNPNDIKRIIAIASSDAPDGVLDLAFRRIGEMPRDQVVEKLYDQFKTDKWKVRRAAAATILKMSTVKNIDEFMSKLPDGKDEKGFAMSEALAYGDLMGDLKEGKPFDVLKKYFEHGSGAQRASALSWYYKYGTVADVSAIQAYETEKTKAPQCEAEDCKWACDVQKEGSKEYETKDVKTIGDFVKLCIEPKLRDTKPEPKK